MTLAMAPSIVIPVCIAADERYLDGLICTAASVLVNSSDAYLLKFYFFLNGNTERMRQSILSSLSKINKDFKIIFVNRDYAEFSQFPDFFYDSPMLYARLLTERYVEEEKYIYLDSDLLFCSDISDLFHTPLEGYALGGCIDETVKVMSNDCPRHRSCGIDASAPSMNSGVLLINRVKVSEEGLFQAAIDHLKNKPQECILHDQSAINFACYGRWKVLDQRWNKMINHLTGDDLLMPVSRPHVIHFVTNFKPWMFYSDRLAFRMYREYLKRFGSLRQRLGVARSLAKLWVRRSLHRLRPSFLPLKELNRRVSRLYDGDVIMKPGSDLCDQQRLLIDRATRK